MTEHRDGHDSATVSDVDRALQMVKKRNGPPVIVLEDAKPPDPLPQGPVIEKLKPPPVGERVIDTEVINPEIVKTAGPDDTVKELTDFLQGKKPPTSGQSNRGSVLGRVSGFFRRR